MGADISDDEFIDEIVCVSQVFVARLGRITPEINTVYNDGNLPWINLPANQVLLKGVGQGHDASRSLI